jgi:hypothetical protein
VGDGEGAAVGVEKAVALGIGLELGVMLALDPDGSPGEAPGLVVAGLVQPIARTARKANTRTIGRI